MESSRLLRDGRPVALLTRRREWRVRYARVVPLMDVRYESDDPMDAVVAHFFGVVCGAGDQNALIRFGTVHRVFDPYGNAGADDTGGVGWAMWDAPWTTGLGYEPAGERLRRCGRWWRLRRRWRRLRRRRWGRWRGRR